MTHKHTYLLLAFFGALLTLELASSSTDNEYMKREHSLVRPFQGKIRAHFFRFIVYTYQNFAMIHENSNICRRWRCTATLGLSGQYNGHQQLHKTDAGFAIKERSSVELLGMLT